MKWVLSHTTDEFHHWLLQHEEGSRSLTLNRQRLSLRLNGSSKRLFFLQVQGFLNKKVLLCSEYGVVLGETPFNEKPAAAQLLFNGQRFSYAVEEGKLVLFDSERNIVGESDITEEATADKYELYALVFGLAWFLTADVVAEKQRVLPVTA
jgi:hypothetical protein